MAISGIGSRVHPANRAVSTGLANAVAFGYVLNGKASIYWPMYFTTAIGMCTVAWFGANRISGLLASVAVGMALGTPFWVTAHEFTTLLNAFLIWLGSASVIGVTYNYMMRRISTRRSGSILGGLREVHMFETLAWSWTTAYKGLVGGLVISVMFAATGA